jgi:hypothetical protein
MWHYFQFCAAELEVLGTFCPDWPLAIFMISFFQVDIISGMSAWHVGMYLNNEAEDQMQCDIFLNELGIYVHIACSLESESKLVHCSYHSETCWLASSVKLVTMIYVTLLF